jgi:hypothetical protein
VRPLSPQHGRLHPGQGVQPAQPAHHPPAGQTDERPAAVRAVAAQGQADGATDPQPAGAEGVRLQGRGQFPRVSKINFLLRFHVFPSHNENIWKNYID